MRQTSLPTRSLRLQMSNWLNLVVTCTSRKRISPERCRRIRTLKSKAITDRAERWIRTLSSASSNNPTQAERLYCGEHWSVVQSIPAVAARVGRRMRIWICSAGYGLISPSSQVQSYSATFSAYELDCVTGGVNGTDRSRAAKEWWTRLSGWKGPGPDSVRTLSQIARRYPKDALVVVASPDYLLAVEDDLKDASKELSDQKLLMLISAGTRQLGALSKHLLPCDARLQRCLGGTRVSLNARIARRLIGSSSTGVIDIISAKRYLSALLHSQPALVRVSRAPSTNAQLKHFIKQEVAAGGKPSASTLLRRLRARGRACEQSRFVRIYRMAVGAE
jgi:hypothetical protein